ncbi:MAG: aminoacyl-tRNA hydrolase [Candidatus Melainabacteria bacterium]
MSQDTPAAADSPWLIVGLGNPGPRYEMTRHNVGFMAIHHLAEQAGIAARQEGKFNAMVGKGTLHGAPVHLVQPLTFMNLSGEAVGKLAHYYKIPVEQVLVIYDDTALPFGKIRVRPGGSDGGHNGIKSLIQNFGGNNRFPRIRIGVGSPEGGISLENYVLSRFSDPELSDLSVILRHTEEAVYCCLAEGIPVASNRFNGLTLLETSGPQA